MESLLVGGFSVENSWRAMSLMMAFFQSVKCVGSSDGVFVTVLLMKLDMASMTAVIVSVKLNGCVSMYFVPLVIRSMRNVAVVWSVVKCLMILGLAVLMWLS